jgi:hypothetical protein
MTKVTEVVFSPCANANWLPGAGKWGAPACTHVKYQNFNNPALIHFHPITGNQAAAFKGVRPEQCGPQARANLEIWSEQFWATDLAVLSTRTRGEYG